jgi:hypothetical protein
MILVPLILIGLAIAGTEFNKAYWDHKVRELCEKDGGVTVYEAIELSPEEFKRRGGCERSDYCPG